MKSLARSVYQSTAEACATLVAQISWIEMPFVSVGSRLSHQPGIGRFYRSVTFRLADRLRRSGRQYRPLSIAGRRLIVDVTEFTTHGLYFTNARYEPATTDFLINTLKPGGVFVDVGANHGYFTLIAASRVGASGRVYAFEPNPPVFDQLATHIRLNGFDDRVQASAVALSDADGEATFYVSQCESNSGLSSLTPTAERLELGSLSPDHTVRVRAETFDAWRQRTRPGRIDLMKIDVEGAEDRVLCGMSASLRAGVIDSIVCETEWDGVVHRRLTEAGYDARPLESGIGFTNLVFVRRTA
jgi:FkbM family methyltransferase